MSLPLNGRALLVKMADYTYNSDKWNRCSDGSLYNSVLSTVFSNEGAEPLTVDEVKSWGKIEQSTDDQIIEDLITAARQVCEDYTAIGFITRTITAVLNLAYGGFWLPYGPVSGDPVAEDENGNDIDLSYKLGQINTTGQMQVTYDGGYSVLPMKLKTAIRQQFLFMYENRGESVTDLSPMAKSTLERVRMVV